MVVTIHYVGFHPSLIFEGFEQIRLKYPIEAVYLLFDGKQDRYGAVSKYNVRRLAEAIQFFKPVLVNVNPLSFRSVFSKVYAILNKEKGKRIFIDVTDMPPMMAATVTIAASMFEGVELLGVYAEQRGEFIPDPDTLEFEEFIEKKDGVTAQGIYFIEMPEERIKVIGQREEERYYEEKILEILYERRGSAESISKLIEWFGKDPRDPLTKVQFSRLVAQMEKKGLVRREHRGRTRSVSLTELGRAIAEALRKGEVGRPLKPLVRPKLRTLGL